MNRRLRAWLAQWGPVLPLLLAEATIWLGFGALLPILPIYFTQHGVDLPTLGVVVAAWPAARLIGEPFFGWLADRRRAAADDDHRPGARLRVRGPAPVHRGAGGVHPPPGVLGDGGGDVRPGRPRLPRRREPARNARARRSACTVRRRPAASCSGPRSAACWRRSRASPRSCSGSPASRCWCPRSWWPSWFPEREHLHAADTATATAAAVAAGEDEVVDAAGWSRPVRLLNVLLVAAIMFNVGSYFAGGSYEVIWSLYMTSLGADLAAIGLTFFSFGLPPLLLSPFTGRFIDRAGGFWALVIGVAGIGLCGLLYPLVPEIWWMVVLGLVEGSAFALLSPAVFLLAARAAPPGRTSSAQGLLGGAGTVGTIVASLAAGSLAAIDLRYPFWVTGVGHAGHAGAGPGHRPAPALRRHAAPGRAGSGGGLRVGCGRVTARPLDGRGPRWTAARAGRAGARRVPDLAAPVPAARSRAPRARGGRRGGGRRVDDGLAARRLPGSRADPHPVRACAPGGLPPVRRAVGWGAGAGHRALGGRDVGAPADVAGPVRRAAAQRLLADRGHRDPRDPARRRAPRRVAEPRRRRGGRVRQPRGSGTVLRPGDRVPRRGVAAGSSGGVPARWASVGPGPSTGT